MSLWRDFLDDVAGPVERNIKAVPSLVKSLVGGIAVAGTEIASSTVMPKGLPAKVQKDAARSLQEASRAGIQENLGYDIKKNPANADPLLYTADALVRNILSPYITRPAATVGLLSDTNSPLYKAKEYEKGFQLSDITDAYSRSEQVSIAQSLTKSTLIPVVGGLSSAVLSAGNIDLNEVNLFNDEDVKKTYSDNVVGKWFTGIGDFFAGNLVISGEIKAIGNVGKFIGRKTGLSMAKQTIDNFANDINEGLIHIASAGKSGKASNAAIQIDALAKSDDINFVVSQVENYSFNDQLPNLILKAKDPSLVADLILADKGYIPALERLSTTNPDSLWKMTDVNSHLRELYLRTGKVVQPDAKAMERINAAMDASIAKNPVHQQIKDAFLDPAGNRKVLGKDNYFPMEPVIGAETLGNAVVKASKISAQVRTRNFDKTGIFTEIVIGDGSKGATTSLLRLATTRKPMGMISVSGERPFDAVDEINAYFDDFNLFKSGTNLIKIGANKTVTAAEYRSTLIKDVMEQQTSVGKEEVIKSFNKVFGRDIARTYGHTDMAQVDAFVASIESEVYGMHNSIAKNGFAIDVGGRRIITDPKTTRQFAESIRLLPYNIIEKELLRASKNKFGSAKIAVTEQSKGFFEILNKYWTFDVLGRPSYIPKNSIFEPALSGVLAQGVSYITDNIYSATKNGLFNNANRAKMIASKMYNAKDAKVVNETVGALHDKLNNAYAMLDDLTAEYAAFIDGTVSPATRVEYIGRVESDLKKAQKLVENTEIELGSALRPMGLEVPSIPSIANLEARVKYLENSKFDKAKSATLGSVIANAKAAIGQAKGSIHSMVTDPVQLDIVNRNIEKQYTAIEKIIAELGEANVQQANVFGKSAEYKVRRYGKQVSSHRLINGQYVAIDSLFDPNQFGAAYRATLSNSVTTAVNYLGELKVGVKQNILSRRASQQITDINSPIYFEELAHIANRFIRKDDLMDQILSGKSKKDLYEWALKNKSYMNAFGVTSESQIPEFITDRVNFVNRYFPDETAKALILKQEVSSVDLQKILASKMGELHPIHPNDFDHFKGTQSSSIVGLASIDSRLSDAAGAVWRKLTAPENGQRWVYADSYFLDTVARKGNAIAQKGISLGIDEINAIRQAAARETIKETENVFYTVRRPNRALFMARVAFGFPTASANAMYRYGRFAGKNPGRVGGFLNSYQGLYNSFGVDKYGNPVDDASKATHIVLPGTADMKSLGGPVLIPAKSVGFLLNYATPSVWFTVALGTIMKFKPKVEDTVKQIIGETNYEIFFPYGAKSDVSQTFTPTWLQDLITGIKGDLGDQKFADSVISNWDMAMTLFEMDKGPKPVFNKVVKEAQKSYLKKAGWGFASPLGAPIKVDLKPNAIVEDYYSILVNKYKQKGFDTLEAEKYAEKEMLVHIPKLPVDRVKFRGSDKNAYIAPTQESYSRIWEQHSELAKKLAYLDVSTVALLTADIETDPSKFSTSIYSFLNNPKTQLPGNFPVNKLPLSPERLENQLQINRTWNKYIALRDALTAKVVEAGGKSLRQSPELQNILKVYANTELKDASQTWWQEYKKNAGVKNNAFTQAQALYLIVNNEDFMKQHGKSKFWEDTNTFLRKRQDFGKIYSELKNTNDKSKFREGYLLSVESSLGTYHPRLQEMIKRYFDDDNLTMVG